MGSRTGRGGIEGRRRGGLCATQPETRKLVILDQEVGYCSFASADWARYADEHVAGWIEGDQRRGSRRGLLDGSPGNAL